MWCWNLEQNMFIFTWLVCNWKTEEKTNLNETFAILNLFFFFKIEINSFQNFSWVPWPWIEPMHPLDRPALVNARSIFLDTDEERTVFLSDGYYWQFYYSYWKKATHHNNFNFFLYFFSKCSTIMVDQIVNIFKVCIILTVHETCIAEYRINRVFKVLSKRSLS